MIFQILCCLLLDAQSKTSKHVNSFVAHCTIDRVISRNAYWLKLPASFGQVHPVFSVTLLCPYDDDPITECQERHPPLPPPVVCDGIEEYEVEKILDSQIFCRKVEYLVRWKGYGVEEDEWQPSRDVRGSKWLVAEFHRTHPQAPRP